MLIPRDPVGATASGKALQELCNLSLVFPGLRSINSATILTKCVIYYWLLLPPPPHLAQLSLELLGDKNDLRPV